MKCRCLVPSHTYHKAGVLDITQQGAGQLFAPVWVYNCTQEKEKGARALQA